MAKVRRDAWLLESPLSLTLLGVQRKRSWEVAAPSSGAALDADAALFEFHTCCPHTKLAVCTCPYFAPQQPPVDLAMAGKLWQWLQDALKERAIRMRLLAEHPGFYRNEQELREDAAYERLRERCFETRPHQFPAFSSASEPTPVAFCPVDPRRPTSGMDDIMAAPTPWATLGLDWSRTKASTVRAC